MTTVNNNSFTGVWTALITPFDSSGELDYQAFDTLIARQVDAGVDGLVLCGTTGEAPTLSVTEKLSLVKRVKAHYQGKLSLMVGCGSSHTQQTVEFSKLCVDSGAESLMVVTPPYNKPSLTGLIAHYKAVCSANPETPVVVYHVPGRTGQKLSTSELAQLVHSHKQILAVKEASGNPIELARFIVEALTLGSSSKQVSWLSGDDHGFLPSLACGAHGVISVLSNVFPEGFVRLYKAWNQPSVNNQALAVKLHQTLFPFMDELFLEVNPIPVKAILHRIGLISSKLRLPLHQADETFSDKLEESYNKTKKDLDQLLQLEV